MRVVWHKRILISFALALCTIGAGCGSKNTNEVVVYCALDQEFSESILKDFEERTGIKVLAKYDVESTKTVGLAQQLLREKDKPRCDLFWNNEALHTVRLGKEGVFAKVDSAVGMEYPAELRPADGIWYPFAARIRVLLVNTKLVEEAVIPQTTQELTLPRWRNQVGIAKPLFGTTATHAACLFATLGDEKARALFRKLKENDIRILSGNKQVATEVGQGSLAMGLTDTDDALAELKAKRPVRMIYLDTAADGLGLIVIPNTVAVIASGPHPENAKKLLDFVLSPETEKKLALGESGQIPLHPKTMATPGLGIPQDAKKMKIDWAKVSDVWEPAMKFVRDEFSGS